MGSRARLFLDFPKVKRQNLTARNLTNKDEENWQLSQVADLNASSSIHIALHVPLAIEEEPNDE